MREPRSRLGMLALLALLCIWSSVAEAAVRVVPPRGWRESSAAAPEAQRRASRWKDALGLRLEQVVSAPADDRFAETAAVFERLTPVPAQLMSDERRALAELGEVVANLVGADAPKEGGFATTTTGEQVIWGLWIVDDLAYQCVLAPSAETASVVVMVARARDLGQELERFDGLVTSLEGVTAPMPRFSLISWRVGALLVWLALALALHAAMLRFVDQEYDHSQAGRRASLINLGLVVLGTLIAYWSLGGRELAITHAGGSRQGLTMWVAVSGMIVAGAHFMIASRFDRGVVQSAPASGAFASGTYSSADILRSSISRSNMRMHELESGDEPGRAPAVGVPSSVSDTGSVGSMSGITIDPAERE